MDALLDDPVQTALLANALAAAVAQGGAVGLGPLLLALGTAHLRSGDPAGAQDLLREAAVAMAQGDERVRGRLAVRQAATHLALGEVGGARACLAGAATLLRALDAPLLGEASGVLAQAGDDLAAAALNELARARRASAPEQGEGRVEVLSRLVSALSSSTADTAEPLWAILRAILGESGGDRSCLMLYEGSRLSFELGLTREGATLAAADFAYSTTIVERALQRREPVVVPDVTAVLPYALASSARELGLRAAVCAPLRVGRKRVGASHTLPAPATLRGLAGVLYVDARAPGAFGPDDAPFFAVLADCALIALRARLTASALAEAEARRPPDASHRARPTGQHAATRGSRAPAGRPSMPRILSRDPGMHAALDLVERVAPSDAAVLISGESGTGKELVAQALHRLSARRAGPWVAVNCAALPEALVQRELFGYERGAFTGADTSAPGLFERAHGGTLFLDEVGEMPSPMQAALLRAVQEGEVRRVGGQTARPVDVRLVAATHRDLRALVERGAFRQDLLYRLCGFEVRIPPLRARPGDVALLAEAFLAAEAEPLRLHPDALARLEDHPWPGNVRELENVVRSAAILAEGGELSLAQIDEVLSAQPAPWREEGARLEGSMEEIERRAIVERLAACEWNQVQAARSLGIDRNTLRRKIQRHGIARGERP
ncbi:MAG: sigma 54-interacting transcriptional regulator [Planctomycetes bacterium]|nr:sigma 54-interacting transcriptional regulator [Planctomycetota bacterium]